MEQLRGPVCQSCGAMMDQPGDFGTEKNGIQSVRFCRDCYQNGQFTEPNISMDEMIQRVTDRLAAKLKIPEEQARQVAKVLVPQLRRWIG